MTTKTRTRTKSPTEQDYLVVVAPYDSDSRYRRVHMKGTGWISLEREEFEPRIRRLFPDIDLNDPRQVHWDDHPWEWPPWHPGEA
jgi:hypothetical protein